MSVPARRGPWWYYSRTEEGKSYAIHCRRPARGRTELPPAGEPGGEEQILLDENALAEGSEYFAVGSAAVSHDHRWLAYGTDRAGNEKYELRFLPLDAETSPAAAAESVPDTGYGLAWSAGADHVFYVRLDEAHRPFQLWRHRLGADPGEDVLVFEEGDRRFSLVTGSTRDAAFVLIGLHSTNTSEWLAIPSDDPLAEPTVVMERREGVEYAVDHLTPRVGRDGLVRGPHQRRCPRLPRPRRPRHRTRDGSPLAGDRDAPARCARRGRRRLLLGAGAERARGGPDPGARPPAPRGRGPLRGRPARLGLDRPLHRQPLGDVAGPQPRAGRAGAAHRADVPRDTLERPAGGPGRTRGDAAQAGARPGRLRPGALHDLPGVGRRTRRDPCPALGGPPPWAGAAGALPALRVRRLRDLHRPVLLAPPALAPRPGRRLRHRARPRRRGDGARLVRGRADGAQAQHVLRLHRLRAPSPGRGDRPAGGTGGPGRVGRRAADRRRGEPGSGALPRRWWPRCRSWTA